MLVSISGRTNIKERTFLSWLISGCTIQLHLKMLVRFWSRCELWFVTTMRLFAPLGWHKQMSKNTQHSWRRCIKSDPAALVSVLASPTSGTLFWSKCIIPYFYFCLALLSIGTCLSVSGRSVVQYYYPDVRIGSAAVPDAGGASAEIPAGAFLLK